MEAKEIIARRVAHELKDGYVVNLGIGLPTTVPRFLPPGGNITLQSENGFLGLAPLDGEPIPGVVNAGGGYPAAFTRALRFLTVRCRSR